MESKRRSTTPSVKTKVKHTPSHLLIAKALNSGDQIVGGALFSSAQFVEILQHGASKTTHSILELLPWWAIVHGLFQIAEGVARARDEEDQKRLYTRGEKKFKNITQMFFGLILLQSGIGKLTGAQFIHVTSLHLLSLRFAICAGVEFLTALSDLYRALSHDPFFKNEIGTNDFIEIAEIERGESPDSRYVPQGSRLEIWEAFNNVFAKGCACAGWTALFLGHPFAWATLIVASAAFYLIKQAVPLALSLYGSGYFNMRNSYHEAFVKQQADKKSDIAGAAQASLGLESGGIRGLI